MDKEDKEPEQTKPSDGKRNPAGPSSPRGNPETDHESVAKGREQLDKVSGN